jgi:5-methyltetrahydropteroyltriglutamate--homocysteine methyltransferase
MRRSVDRILTTHTGSLPRPARLREVLAAETPPDAGTLAARVKEAVAELVRLQADAGVDVLNDGEASKESYSTYVRERLGGFEGQGEAVLTLADLEDFPGFQERWASQWGSQAGAVLQPPACINDVRVKDRHLVESDIENLRAAAGSVQAADVFMTAASPGVIAAFFSNHHYKTHEAFLAAIADAMQEEYEAIARAGFVLQLDCPDLAMCRHLQFESLSLEEFRRTARQHVEVLNHATRNLDPDQMRLHLCWGNYEGPHHKDVALRDIVDVVLEARPNGISLEAANPRHEHEWRVFEDVRLPDGKLLIPGVIDSTNNYIEHPEVIAQRLVRYAKLVGAENVVAGSDCGFGTAASISYVDWDITWAKFRALAEGAQLATDELKATA